MGKDLKDLKSARRPLQTQSNLSIREKLRNSGLRNFLVETSWSKLALLLLVFYSILGLLVGIMSYICSLWRRESEDSDSAVEDSDSAANESNSSFYLWCWRGFWLLLVNPTWDPKSMPEYFVGTVVPVLGSLFALLLHGVVYDKFSGRHSSILFANAATLRRGGEAHNGHLVLTFRYFNTRGLIIGTPQMRCVAARRELMADGDGIIVHPEVKIANLPSVLPAAFFIHHIICDGSPFYDPTSPKSCSFVGSLGIFLSVTGVDIASQELHSGFQQINLDDIVCDQKFAPMLQATKDWQEKQKNIIGSHRLDFSTINGLDILDLSPEMRVLRHGITHASMGLPASEAEEAAQKMRDESSKEAKEFCQTMQDEKVTDLSLASETTDLSLISETGRTARFSL